MPRKAKDRLRPYQVALVKEATAALSHHGSVVLQLPTGGGKTHIATEMAQKAISRGKRVWFICHREEIREQTAEAFDAIGLSFGNVTPRDKVEDEYLIQLCSVGSLPGRLAKLTPPDIVIWDECHHVVARMWAKLKGNLPNATHLGLTATPDRLDGAGLRAVFDHLICGTDTRALIEQDFLSPFRLFGPSIPDMRGVKTKLGDWDKAGAEEAMRPVLVGDMVEHYKRLCPDARAIAFAISVKASQEVVERFRAAGIPAQHVDGTTPREERKAAVEALRLGTIKVLSNCELFTEGFDLPAIDAVILLRPTKSLALYRQMVGRGLRPAEGKAATVILDHAGLVHEHGLPDEEITWTLDGHSRPAESGEDGEGRPRLRRCPECSAIHAWAPACVECGHVYVPEDRTIEEVYGTLRQFVVSETHESTNKFAKRVGLPNTTIRTLVKRGLPADGLRVEIEAGLQWFRKNYKSPMTPPVGEDPNAFEPVNKFLSRAKINHRDFKKMVTAGLPCAANGWVQIERGLEWVKAHRVSSRSAPPEAQDAETYEAVLKFAERLGIDFSMVYRWIKKGIPTASNGWIDIEKGLDWVVDHYRDRPVHAPGIKRLIAERS